MNEPDKDPMKGSDALQRDDKMKAALNAAIIRKERKEQSKRKTLVYAHYRLQTMEHKNAQLIGAALKTNRALSKSNVARHKLEHKNAHLRCENGRLQRALHVSNADKEALEDQVHRAQAEVQAIRRNMKHQLREKIKDLLELREKMDLEIDRMMDVSIPIAPADKKLLLSPPKRNELSQLHHYSHCTHCHRQQGTLSSSMNAYHSSPRMNSEGRSNFPKAEPTSTIHASAKQKDQTSALFYAPSPRSEKRK